MGAHRKMEGMKERMKEGGSKLNKKPSILRRLWFPQPIPPRSVWYCIPYKERDFFNSSRYIQLL